MLTSIVPGSSIASEIIGPIITTVTGDVLQRLLSGIESNRISQVVRLMQTKVNQRINTGDNPRRDDFFYIDECQQRPASKLLENTILKCRAEFEAKKLEYYSNFWVNVCFDNNVSYETANSLITLFSSLSCQQMRILTYLNSGNNIPMAKWEKYMFSNQELSYYYTLYTDCLQLYNIRLAGQPNTEQGIRIGTPDICISPSGKLMCYLFELERKQSF